MWFGQMHVGVNKQILEYGKNVYENEYYKKISGIKL